MAGGDNHTSEILNCYNIGELYSDRTVGGIVGEVNGDNYIIEYCYNIGTIAGKGSSSYKGSIVGYKWSAIIQNCYYPSTSTIKAVENEDDEANNVFGLDEEYMQSEDFVTLLNGNNEKNIWKRGNSNYQYPMLNWQQYTQKLEIDLGTYEEKQDENARYITKIAPETIIAEVLENIETNGAIEIYKGTQKITDTETNIGTGMTVKISFNNQEQEYTVVVKGDINGDGNAKLSDLSKLKLSVIGSTQLEGAYKEAADLNGDGNVKLSDLSKMKLYLVGNGSL